MVGSEARFLASSEQKPELKKGLVLVVFARTIGLALELVQQFLSPFRTDKNQLEMFKVRP